MLPAVSSRYGVIASGAGGPSYGSSRGNMLVARNRLGVDSEHADIDAMLNMALTDQETEVVPPAEEPEELPLPNIAILV